MTNFKRTRVLIHLLAGGGVVLTSFLADRILSQTFFWGLPQSLALVTGLGIIAIGFVPLHMGVIPRVSTNLCLSLLSLFVFFAVGEGFFRVIGYDFAAGEVRAWHKTPIYYRQPIAPTGDVFFKRPGSGRWTGQVLSTQVKYHGILPNPYTNEPVITVKTYKSNDYGHEVYIKGESTVMYSPDKPLSCGAKVWIETGSEVMVFNNHANGINKAITQIK